jgi:hypothetical protein
VVLSRVTGMRATSMHEAGLSTWASVRNAIEADAAFEDHEGHEGLGRSAAAPASPRSW